MRPLPTTKDFDYSDLPGIGPRRAKHVRVKLDLSLSNSSEAGFFELLVAMRIDAISKQELIIMGADGVPLRRINCSYLRDAGDLRKIAAECMMAVKYKALRVELMSSSPLSDDEVLVDSQHLIGFYNVEIAMATSDREKLDAIVKYCRGMLQYQPYETGNDFIYGMLVPYLLCFQNGLTLPKTKYYVKANKGIKVIVDAMLVDIDKVHAFTEDNMPSHVLPCGIADMRLMYCAQVGYIRDMGDLIESVEHSILVEAQYVAACCGHAPFIDALRTACRASGITMGLEARAYNGETPLQGAKLHRKPKAAAWLTAQREKMRLFSVAAERTGATAPAPVDEVSALTV
ncbi:MAG: hypothetical protein P1U34_02810 [Coxiellaceae bacterium]|nr:hypothetical protein [Coxiellaceae bacterium]